MTDAASTLSAIILHYLAESLGTSITVRTLPDCHLPRLIIWTPPKPFPLNTDLKVTERIFLDTHPDYLEIYTIFNNKITIIPTSDPDLLEKTKKIIVTTLYCRRPP